MKEFKLHILVLLVITLAAIQPATSSEALMDPSTLADQAPDTCLIKFETSKGDFVLKITREWSPIGADRFYNLVMNDYFNDVRFFRVVPNFVVQFGLHADPAVNTIWREATIKDEPVNASNVKGAITFAKGGPDSRTTQVFINLRDNIRLDGMGFSPFGKVIEGMDVVEKLFGGYGDGAPRGRGPNQGKIVTEGNDYLIREFPDLDYIKKATVMKAEPAETEKASE